MSRQARTASPPGGASRPATSLIRQVDMDRATPLVDFAGRATTMGAFAASEKARMSPTLMFYGPDGRQLAEPIVGFKLADFYGAYIDRAIEEARGRLVAGSER